MSRYYAACVYIFTLVSLSICTYELHEPYLLSSYRSYADVRFTFFTIPDAIGWVNWSFTLLSDPDNIDRTCDLVNATVYIQAGGLPVFAPLNETFPDDFMVTSSSYASVVLSSYPNLSRLVNLIIISPEPGRWFSASYIQPYNKPGYIRPQAFSPTQCSHYLRTSISYSVEPYSRQISFPVEASQSFDTANGEALLRYFIAQHVYKYTITVVDCQVVLSDNTSCTFEIHSNEDKLPASRNIHVMKCDWKGNSTACMLTIDQPTVNRWHFISAETDGNSVILRITLRISVQGCDGRLTAALPCLVDEYFTDIVSSNPYTVDYIRSAPQIIVRDDKAYHASFNVESLMHSGGTLDYTLHPSPPENSEAINAVLFSCITRNRFTTDVQQIKSCAEANKVTADYSSGSQAKTYIPYPLEGIWYISIVAECYNSTTDREHSVTDCKGTLTFYNNVTIRPCVNNTCGKYGECGMYFRGILHWSACRCKAGYRGYGCTDASEARSDSMQLLETLLLTLSNIMFAVAGAWAISRKWFSEALIYFFVLCASSFYHACDNGTIYTLCVLDYGVLQYCDFYGSILAVWMTAMALSEIPHRLRSFLHIAGVLGILIGTQISLRGLWNFVIPLIIAIVILATSWARLCKREKSCYPKLKIWLIQLLPGAVCALVGLALYSFVETDDNYFYVHSIWHLLMAFAILILLPRDKTLKCSSIKNWFCRMKSARLRRNEVTDEVAAVDDNQPVLIESESSGSTTPDNP